MSLASKLAYKADKLYPSGGGRELKEDGTWTRAGAYEPSHFEQWKITKDKKLPVMVILGESYSHQ